MPRFWLYVLALLLLVTSCTGSQSETQAEGTLPDTLRVVTLSGSTTYFQYRDTEMGYQYELLRLFSDYIKIPFVIETAPDLDSIHRKILSGEAHLSITPEAVTRSGKQRFIYTGPEEESHMVLVQRSPKASGRSPYVSDVTQLLDKSIYVLAGTHYVQRLKNLEAQLGGDIHIIELHGDSIDTEGLIALVATDSIDYTVVDSDLGRLARTYYPNIDVRTSISFAQRLRWITSIQDSLIAQSIDRWYAEAPTVSNAQGIYRKYFELYKVDIPGATSGRTYAEVHRLVNGSISPYDQIFKDEAKRLGQPWTLLASIAYQESNFRADIVGWSGARGLMGIMPRTGASFGASRDELLQPSVSVRVSVDCLLATERYFRSVTDPVQRLKFTLAGYNAGVAHIQDAQRLARKYGHDPNIWDDHVEQYILLKGDRRYYTDPVCRYGYLRGRETYSYVREVMERYHRYETLR